MHNMAGPEETRFSTCFYSSLHTQFCKKQTTGGENKNKTSSSLSPFRLPAFSYCPRRSGMDLAWNSLIEKEDLNPGPACFPSSIYLIPRGSRESTKTGSGRQESQTWCECENGHARPCFSDAAREEWWWQGASCLSLLPTGFTPILIWECATRIVSQSEDSRHKPTLSLSQS